jgi:hypothetical protein
MNTKPVMDRPRYESIINYPTMIDSIVQICIDPYFPPASGTYHIKGWHKIGSNVRTANKLYYVSPTWKFSKEVKEYYTHRKDWEMVVYPKQLLPNFKIDFIGKPKQKDVTLGDSVFQKGVLISKILTLDHFLGNKKYMYDILSNDPRSFAFLPKTLTIDTEIPGWKDNIKRAMKRKTWILKPSIGLRGTDIFISDKVTSVIKYINTHSNYIQWVLSEYINNPFLLKIHGKHFDDKIGRKTHIRIYTMVSNVKGDYNIYMYDKPLLFAAAKEYTTEIDDFSHLTNLFVASKYYKEVLFLNPSDAYRDLSFDLIETLDTLYGPSFYEENVLPQLKNILQVILENTKEYLVCNTKEIPGKRNCFQNIAIDIMPDKNWKLYLLEINGKPGMNAPSYRWGGLKKFTGTFMKLNSKS